MVLWVVMGSASGRAKALPEDALIERARQGDPLAFRRIVELFGPRVHRVIHRYLGASADADDVAQEVFIRLHAALPRFRRDASFLTFLYRIVTNVCVNTYHAANRRPRTFSELARDDEPDAGSAVEALAAHESAEATVLRRERQQAVHRAIQAIPDPYRMVFILAEIEGMTGQEIAVALGTNTGTVKSRLSRARSHFRTTILESRELFRD